MKKLFAYTLTILAFASCTSDGLIVDVQEEIQTPDEKGMSVDIEPINVVGDMGTRSSLYYDKLSSDVSKFLWGGDESLGVFAYQSNLHPQQMQFELVNDANAASSLTRLIKPAQGVNALTENTTYVAYFPYNVEIEDYTKIPIDYRGQVQTGHVNMHVYLDLKTTGDANYPTYLASEKAASSHLGGYDYLCSAPQSTNYKAGINFPLKRVGSTSRFYIKFPKSGLMYDSLQVFHPTIDFVLTATMNAASPAASALTPGITSHTMSLEFNEAEAPEHGFDLTLGADGITPVDETFFDYYKEKYSAYLVAYLMHAPTDFSQSSQVGTIFLFAHEKGHPEKVHYFKSDLPQRPNIPCNMLYRWTLNKPTDAPIEFVETTIEDWKEATGFDNGDAGNGTGGW